MPPMRLGYPSHSGRPPSNATNKRLNMHESIATKQTRMFKVLGLKEDREKMGASYKIVKKVCCK